MDKFKEWLIIKGYSSRTIETIIKATEYFIAWAGKENMSDITETTHNDIIAYIQHYNIRGTGKKTIAHYILHLKKYFDWLISEGGLADNPCSNIKIKGIKRKVLYEILSLEEMGMLYSGYSTVIKADETMKRMPPQQVNELSRKRNKIIVGLLVYQGLRSEEIAKLQITDVKLSEGKIFIAEAKRSNERTLKLESRQVFDLLDYINDTRKQLLHYKQQQTQQLFTGKGNSERFSNMMSYLNKQLQRMNPKLKSLDQLRASVIVHWLKLYNLRKVQVMAGHRYISSTESYKANNLDDLKEDIKNYHPF